MIPIRDSIPSARVPFVNLVLIGANAAVFIYEWTLPVGALEAFIGRWGAVPARFELGQGSILRALAYSPTLVTSIFIHGGPLHVAFNMLYLWIFGDNVEDRLGHARYLVFYLICGVAASVCQVIFGGQSTLPIVGASGAIGGVMGAYLIAFPRARVLTLFWFFIIIRMIWVPAVLYLGVWFLLQLLQAARGWGAVGEAGQGGVAIWAHVGGFAAGAILILVMKKAPPPRRSAAKARSSAEEDDRWFEGRRRPSRYR